MNQANHGEGRASVDRYARHRAIPGFSQEALQALRVTVVGAGAIGNEVIKNLCLLGVGTVRVHDLDRTERHNLTRSILLRESDVGRPKADAVVARARRIDPVVRLEAIEGDIRDTLGPCAAGEADVVIGALDNFEARLWLNRVCWLAGTPWVNAAIDHRHASVEAFLLPDGACYECALPASVYARLAERQSCGGLARAARAQRVMPTTAITASVAGALAVQRALALPAGSRRTLVDTAGGAGSDAAIGREPACPCCSGARPGHRSRWPGAGLPDLATALAAGRWASGDAPPPDVALAEPLIVAAGCARCGATAATRALVGQRARDVPDTATFCFACGEASIAVEIRDRLDPSEFAALADTVADSPAGSPPLAFVQVGDHLIDLTAVGPAVEPAVQPPTQQPRSAAPAAPEHDPETPRWPNAR